MNGDEKRTLVDQVAQAVVERIALGNKVNQLADQAITRMALGNVRLATVPVRSPEIGYDVAEIGADPSTETPGMGSQRKKLILKSKLSPGDILMLTAAVRDLHLTYPGQFLTDVRTPFPQLWENNPYITSLSAHEPDVESIDCRYPLVHRSNHVPYHFIHAYRQFLNKSLGLRIRPHAFKADIHLRPEERDWISQVEEIMGQPTKFWIIVSGGKSDFTNKIWDTTKFQAVVDHFRGRLTFVQVGQEKHVHPVIDGAINLIGKTDLRQLARLMYHADGVLCGVTMLMHLAAAVETKPGRPRNRPCVVVAGGREPMQWEAYPHHQFLHTNGALPCCDAGGCWKSRVKSLGDGHVQDNSLCYLPIVTKEGQPLPMCMDIITSGDVVQAIELYLKFDSVAPDAVPRNRNTQRQCAVSTNAIVSPIQMTPADACGEAITL